MLPTASHGDRAAPAPALRSAPVEVCGNHIDDDGDGLVDVILPTAANACATGAKGACAEGFAACEGGGRVCLGPSPVPEVFDGVDNDCDGRVDDVPAVSVRPRALVVAPRYAWQDAAPDIATVSAILAQGGIPFDAQPPGTDWAAELEHLDSYSLVVVPGYLVGEVVNADARAAFERFARRGGIVVVFKPVGGGDDRQSLTLTGLRASTRRRDELELRFDGARPAAVSRLDSPEERTLRINDRASTDAVEAYVFDPDPDAGTEVVARAYGGSVSGPTLTRRPLGKGAIYAVGHDLSTFGAATCYVNCFQPSGDVLRLFLEGALREGAAGHVVLDGTAPGGAPSVLVLTHDVDAPDAYNAGPWGPPGALQMATAERARGVRATYNLTTDYVAGYYNEKTVHDLCDLGVCPSGAHSVVHSDRFARLPAGTCSETRATYGKEPTLCGEIRVSRDIVAAATGKRPRAWRSPYLDLPPDLFPMLSKAGFEFDSGFGVGDLPYNLPLDLSAVGFHQNRFGRSPILEFPISCEDGEDAVVGGVHHRVELQESNRAWFVSTWYYTALRNAQNGSATTLLVHPSRGRDQPPENVGVKVRAVADLIDRTKAAGVVALPLEAMGDFWRARLGTKIDATYDDGSGYTGSITVGPVTTAGLTLEFGDVVSHFECAACGSVRVEGKHVVLATALLPGTKAAFRARVR